MTEVDECNPTTRDPFQLELLEAVMRHRSRSGEVKEENNNYQKFDPVINEKMSKYSSKQQLEQSKHRYIFTSLSDNEEDNDVVVTKNKSKTNDDSSQKNINDRDNFLNAFLDIDLNQKHQTHEPVPEPRHNVTREAKGNRPIPQPRVKTPRQEDAMKFKRGKEYDGKRYAHDTIESNPIDYLRNNKNEKHDMKVKLDINDKHDDKSSRYKERYDKFDKTDGKRERNDNSFDAKFVDNKYGRLNKFENSENKKFENKKDNHDEIFDSFDMKSSHSEEKTNDRFDKHSAEGLKSGDSKRGPYGKEFEKFDGNMMSSSEKKAVKRDDLVRQRLEEKPRRDDFSNSNRKFEERGSEKKEANEPTSRSRHTGEGSKRNVYGNHSEPGHSPEKGLDQSFSRSTEKINKYSPRARKQLNTGEKSRMDKKELDRNGDSKFLENSSGDLDRDISRSGERFDKNLKTSSKNMSRSNERLSEELFRSNNNELKKSSHLNERVDKPSKYSSEKPEKHFSRSAEKIDKNSTRSTERLETKSPRSNKKPENNSLPPGERLDKNSSRSTENVNKDFPQPTVKFGNKNFTGLNEELDKSLSRSNERLNKHISRAHERSSKDLSHPNEKMNEGSLNNRHNNLSHPNERVDHSSAQSNEKFDTRLSHSNKKSNKDISTTQDIGVRRQDETFDRNQELYPDKNTYKRFDDRDRKDDFSMKETENDLRRSGNRHFDDRAPKEAKSDLLQKDRSARDFHNSVEPLSSLHDERKERKLNKEKEEDKSKGRFQNKELDHAKQNTPEYYQVDRLFDSARSSKKPNVAVAESSTTDEGTSRKPNTKKETDSKRPKKSGPMKADLPLSAVTKTPVRKNQDIQRRPLSGSLRQKSKSFTNISNIKPASPRLQSPGSDTTEVQNLDSVALREQIYYDWLQRKKSSDQIVRKSSGRKKKEEEEENENKERERKLLAQKSYDAWNEKKIEMLKSKKDTEKTIKSTEKEKLEEQQQRKQDAKKFFESWKEQKDQMLKEQNRNKLKTEKERKKKEFGDKVERSADAQKTFDNWKSKKDEVLKEKKRAKKKENEAVMEAELEKLDRKQQANRVYESWKEKRAKSKSRPTSALVQRPWCPSSRNAGPSVIPGDVQPVIVRTAPPSRVRTMSATARLQSNTKRSK
ncbi:putative autophagy-related protein 11 isoform X2 [Hydractinia symbiolongicarpus]|nr:putative autophagy-related protein 11 isoform X2 [Hydractinia symbiolongicarpus]